MKKAVAQQLFLKITSEDKKFIASVFINLPSEPVISS